MLIIPVLVEQASMPGAQELPASLAGLRRRQALSLGHASFQHDLRRLMTTVERALSIEPVSAGTSPEEKAKPEAEPAEVVIARVGLVKRWKYRWPDTSIERYHTTTRYTVNDDEGDLDVLVARGYRWAFGRDRGRVVVFGNSGGASSGYHPWTEFVETDDNEYAAKLYNPGDHRKSLRDGDPLPPRFALARVCRTDAVLRSVRNGPSLRLVVKSEDEPAMIRHGHWAAKLRQTI